MIVGPGMTCCVVNPQFACATNCLTMLTADCPKNSPLTITLSEYVVKSTQSSSQLLTYGAGVTSLGTLHTPANNVVDVDVSVKTTGCRGLAMTFGVCVS